MSAITSATAPSGIFRSEIPAQCFNEVKSFAYELFKEFVDDEQGWTSMIERIKEWGDEDVQEEVARLFEEYPDASDNYKYTFLKTIKAMDQRNGASTTQIKMSKLNEIKYADFFKQFIQRIVSSPDLDSLQKYRNLRPSDREIIARDAFRHTIYSETRNKYAAIRGAPRKPPVVAEIDPADSVSQAPSEIISIKPKEDARLSRSILELHNSVSAGGTSSEDETPARKEILKVTSGSKVFKMIPSKTSRITTKSRRVSQATTSKNDDVIECEIDSTSGAPSKRSHRTKTKTNATRASLTSRVSNATTTNVSRASTTHSRKSKIFTRSPRRVAKPQVPCFFEDDGIDINAADVSTHVYR